MPFSHHSHSGEFCPGHAHNSLEEMVQTAIAKSMEVFALTEHMPRHDEDRYPEEMEMGWGYEKAQQSHSTFIQEAIRLRECYQSKIKILIGFESEWIRPGSLELIQLCLQSTNWDLFVGSVHHVHTKPIDFDKAAYAAAKDAAGGTDPQLFADYFDSQFAMLQATTPPITGHFDLVRLFSDHPDQDLREWQPVWERILRNLGFIRSYGGLLEINMASLRKGLRDPYPKDEIAQVSETCPSYYLPLVTVKQAFEQMNGRFCLSDDSHSVEQVALNYSHCMAYLRRNHIDHIHYLEHAHDKPEAALDPRFPSARLRLLTVDELRRHPFWEKTS